MGIVNHPRSRGVVAVALLIVALATAGCAGGGGDDSSGGSTAQQAGSGASTGSPDADVSPTERYADQDVSEIPVEVLRECPDDTTFYYTTRYKDREAQAYCGSATATVKVGSRTLEIDHGYCEVDAGYVNYQLGTVVVAWETGSGTDAQYGPASFGLSLGDQVKDAKPVGADGTYVDGPSVRSKYGATMVIHDDARMWAGDELYHATKVTLTDGRTKGSVTATNFEGVPISVTFECGNRIVGDSAPDA